MFEDLLGFVRSLYPGMPEVPLHAPVLGEDERRGVLEALDSGFVSSVGPHVTRFEDELARLTGATRAVAVVNGTAALHLGLVVLGVKPGELVLTQALTFVATANAISYAGATPVFLDSDADSLGLSPLALTRYLESHAVKRGGAAYQKDGGRRFAACVPMHVFGHPVRMSELLAVCQEWGIPVLEDAAEALGSQCDGYKAGAMAPVGALSFNGNKIVTTGGGGALLFRDEALAARAKHLSTTAKRPHPWAFHHDELGYNYRMPNLNAALGLAQLERLPVFLEAKSRISSAYQDFLGNREDIQFVGARPGTQPNWWLNAMLVRDRATRDRCLEEGQAARVQLRPVWDLMCDLPMYAACPRDGLVNARELAGRLVNLPSGVPA